MHFGFDGEKYKQASAHQKAWGAGLIAELAFEGHEHVLDLGCGDGVLTQQLAERVPEGSVIGIDSCPSMIAAASQLSTPNLSFVLGDINNLDYREAFDVIFSNAALHWIKDHHNLFERVFRAMRPGGALRFSFAGEGNCSNFNRIVQELMSEYPQFFSGFEWPWYMPDLQSYQKLAERFPFRELKVWGENADRLFPNSDAMIRWLDQPSLVPFLSIVPEERRSEFRDKVIDRMLQSTRQPDGQCFETFRRIHLFARK